MANKLTQGSNMMWESSRMMLPEHVNALLQYKEESKKMKKPIIDEQELAEIGFVIMESVHRKIEIEITLWKDGHFINHRGIVNRVDYQMKYILLEQDDEEFERIMISDITSATRL